MLSQTTASPEPRCDLSTCLEPSSKASLYSLVNGYSRWAETRWGTATLPGIDPALASELVMAFGLAGETGEVIEELLNVEEGDVEPFIGALCKELGDAFYYWARIAETFGFPPGHLFASQEVEASMPDYVSDAALRMVVAAGKVQEAAKKYVRDGAMNRAKLEEGLAGFALHWHQMCLMLGLSVEEVLAANRDKIEGRTVRGTLRGSGNDR